MVKALGRFFGFANWKRWASHGWRRGKAFENVLSAKVLEPVLDDGDGSPKSRSFLRYLQAVYGELQAISMALESRRKKGTRTSRTEPGAALCAT